VSPINSDITLKGGFFRNLFLKMIKLLERREGQELDCIPFKNKFVLLQLLFSLL